MKNLIEVKGLTKYYGDFALDQVDLTVHGGTIMGLIGENGAGKSTTLKSILGLVRPDGGTIHVFGRDISETGAEYKQDLGVVLDEGNFHTVFCAEEVGRVLSGLYRNWDDDLYVQYLRRFQIPTKKKIKDYSKGMKMKLSIAAALSHRPKLLLLDEPTSGLDPVVRNELLDEFLDFIRDEEHAILLSSHITSDLERAADYVTYLHKGRVAVQGSKDELLEAYGRLVCSRSDMEKVDPAALVGKRVNNFGCEALVKNKKDFLRSYPGLAVDPVTLEDIMVFTVRGEQE